MRLPSHQNTASRVRTAVAVGLIGGLAVLGGGCNVPSFVDPGETGGLRQPTSKEPLVVKILDDLDPVLEEGNRQFVTAQPPRAEDLLTETVDYVVGPNDLLSITVSDLQGPGLDTVKQARVSGTGNVTLPYLPNVMRAEGLTEIELQQAVQEAYRQAGVLENASVSVVVVEQLNNTFNIMGSVARPGLYTINRQDFRVLDALTLGGDVINPQLEELYIVRQADQPRRRAGGAGGGGMAPAPATAPAPADDDLAPQGNSGQLPRQLSRAAYLQEAGAADPLDPDAPAEGAADEPAAEIMPENEDPAARVGRIDGQDIVVQPGEDDTAGAAPAAADPGIGMAAPGGQATGSFEFNDPPAATDVRVIRIPVARLRAGDFQYNVAIRPRDTIIIPPGMVGTYSMQGHVANPGAYRFEGQKVTLREAIWAARGLDGLAIPQRTDIVRKISANEKMYVRVDLARVFAGTAPDIYLKPGDEVNVGTNFIAPFLAAVRGGFRFAYGFGFLYDRNYGQQNNFNR